LTALKQIIPNVYIGPRFWYDDLQITEVVDQGILDNGIIPGQKGGKTSGLGLASVYDTRDTIFFPSKGAFVEMIVQPHGKAIGSDFDFLRIQIDAAKYQRIWKNQILALHLFGSVHEGNVPFTQMAMIGGTKKMRGFYEGRFRDNNMWMTQAEYRIPLKWRFGLNLFGGLADVAPTVNAFELKNTKSSYGLGLRYMFDKEKKLNIRVDAGFTEEGMNFYFTFGEAF
jgi:outer membrane protein assembly factor BamA